MVEETKKSEMNQDTYQGQLVSEIFKLRNEIDSLRRHINFLVETFSNRDAANQEVIKQYEQQVVVLAQTVAWFKGAHSPSAVMPSEGKIQ